MSKSVALIIETSKAYGRGLLRSIGRYARIRSNWSIYVQERGLHDSLPDWFTGQFDGMMLRTCDPTVIKFVKKSRVPTVYLGELVPDGETAVLNDDAMCSVLAANHFLECGFRHLAFIGIRDVIWSDTRRDQFEAEVTAGQGNMHLLELGTANSPLTWHQTHQSLVDWLVQLPKPVGIMCCYDAIARSVVDACRACNLMVPEQVALIGVDNDEVLCEVCDPQLTSVAPDTGQLGIAAGQQLDRLMNSKREHQVITVPPRKLIIRGSSDIVAVDDPEIAKALGMIRRRAILGVDVKEIVSQLTISRRTLERKFRDVIGHSLLEEVNRVKIARVKALLENTELSIEEIAFRSGFSYPAYLIATFRKREGKTPLQYRVSKRD